MAKARVISVFKQYVDNPMLWAVLVGISVLGAGACGVVYVKNKKKEDNE